MTNTEALTELYDLRNHGEIYVSANKAAEILGCTSTALTNAANKKNSLGDLKFFWVGNVLKISVESMIDFVGGEYPYQMRRIFAGKGYVDPKILAQLAAELIMLYSGENHE